MQKKLFLLFSLATAVLSNAQESVSIGLIGEYSENFSIRNYSGGFQVGVPVGDNFTLDYKGLIGGSTNRTLYVHAPVGAAFGTILLRYLGGNDTKLITSLGILLYAIPEGITFYPIPDAKIRAGVYIAPLGCDYWYKRNQYEYFRFSGELGGKVKIPLGSSEKADLLLQGGVRYLYRNKDVDPVFIHAGAGISFNLNK